MLPLKTEFAAMEAQLTDRIPSGANWQYEPKWDGFRCLVFKDGENIAMRSKSGQTLDRYFPEIVRALQNLKAKQFVLDGELVISNGNSFSFDDLLLRIHPAQSRIQKLAQAQPASLILFDLLVDADGHNYTDSPIEQRRQRLEQFARTNLHDNNITLSPATTDYDLANSWWQLVGTGLDGIVAKRLGIPYQSGNRQGMVKIKKLRTADCVVGGFRYASDSPTVGSILLGLYDHDGKLNHVGFCSSFKSQERKNLITKLEPLIKPPGFTGNAPGAVSRWSTKRSMDWQPLAPVLVVEIQYDHFTDRFRHGTRLLRWRPDKKPEYCTYDQLEHNAPGTTNLLSPACQ